MASLSGTSVRTFPGFDQVYYAHDPGTAEFRVSMDVSFEQSVALIRGEAIPPAPVSVRWVMGRRKPRDFIWSTFAVPFIVSERFVRLLRENGFDGWSTYWINLFGPEGEPIPGYCGLIVTGRCGPRQPERSPLLTKDGPVGNRIQVYKGLFFDESRWDGSDLFMCSDDNNFVFMVQRLKDALTAGKFRGLALNRVDEDERLFR